MQSRRSFFGLMGGLAALVPGFSLAREVVEPVSPTVPVGEFYSCTFDTDHLELPPAVTVFEWWDDDAVLPRLRPTELNGKRLAQLRTETLRVRRLHIWTTEEALVYFEPECETAGRRWFLPLSETPEGGHEALSARVWRERTEGVAVSPGTMVWVTVGNHKRVRHGMMFLPYDKWSLETSTLSSRLGLGITARTASGGVKLVGDKLSPEEKTAMTGQTYVGELHLGRLGSRTRLTWEKTAEDVYEGTGHGLTAYLCVTERWELSVWKSPLPSTDLEAHVRGACPYALCTDFLGVLS